MTRILFLASVLAGPIARADPGSPVEDAAPADGPNSEAKNRGLREIVVDKARLRLCDVVPDAPKEICDVDLGAAPPAGQRIRLTGRHIRMRFARGLLSELGVVLPEAVIVARKSQVVPESELRRLVEEIARLQLPEGMSLVRARVLGGVELPLGEVTADVVMPKFLRPGKIAIWATILAGGSARRVPATLELTSTVQEAPDTVHRGDVVSIHLKIRSLSIRSEGIAQSSGSEGEFVAVLPSSGRKIVKARVVSPGNVEVVQ